MARLSLDVTGMTCGHCKATVESALRGVPGTMTAAVFLDEGMAEVDYDAGTATPESYVAAVRAAGYAARIAD